jgi:hypothetical protein
MSGGITRQLHGRQQIVYEIALTSTLFDPLLKLVSPLPRTTARTDDLLLNGLTGSRRLKPVHGEFQNTEEISHHGTTGSDSQLVGYAA